MSGPREHWQNIYDSRADNALSWFQARPERSLALIRAHAGAACSVIDVGGGASRLVDELLAAGYVNLSVLDIADSALAHSRARLGALAAKVDWIAADVTSWQPVRSWDVWHDRAVFHFLTGKSAQDAYVQALTRATHEGSFAIIATFALDGPEKCSGLPVQRYSAELLAARLGPGFSLIEQASEQHMTPDGRAQSFTYAVFRRTSAAP
jgi:hypothetical protein